jgi:hypothetical protein
MEELPSAATMGPVLARELLADVAKLRRQSRRPAGLWPPLVCFGVVVSVAAPLTGLTALLWWVLASPAAFAAVGAGSGWQSRRRGIQQRSRRLPALGVISFVGGTMVCAGLTVLWLPLDLAWTVTLAASYLAWSYLARSVPAALVAVGLAGTGVALTLYSAPWWSVQLGVGLVMIAGGLALRFGPEAR